MEMQKVILTAGICQTFVHFTKAPLFDSSPIAPLFQWPNDGFAPVFPLGLHGSLAGKRRVSFLPSIFRVTFAQHGIFKLQMTLCLTIDLTEKQLEDLSSRTQRPQRGIKKGAVLDSNIFSNILGNPVNPNNHSALWATNKY